MKFIQVITTMPKSAQSASRRIARSLVSKRLAVCVQILGPIESIYKWKGRVEKADEHLLLIKTVQLNYKKVESVILKDHPYDVPEIIAIPITQGSKDYLSWLQKETKLR